ncbi:hypothetical protein LCGC14_1523790 [marine sediment metagenome]|uniref:Uncharacterized protein n=1 Tax=marine sediment metagenome TaxID=412755 RepID=A0A0F9IY07_9ZZZZ|nr:hypothetical protein [Pricia sp.]
MDLIQTADIIKEIENLYLEGEEPSQQVVELCSLAGDYDCDCRGSGILTDHLDFNNMAMESVDSICDCITERFKDEV